MSLIEIAEAYRRAGLCACPPASIRNGLRCPNGRPIKPAYPRRRNSPAGSATPTGFCLICGAVSGNLEMLDFDLGGAAFQDWYDAIEGQNPDLLARLVIEQSPSGGWHVVYRSQTSVNGSMKLAQRKQFVDGPEEVTIAGKKYRPRQDANGDLVCALNADRDPRRGRSLPLRPQSRL